MSNKPVPAAGEAMPAMGRRGLLGGMAIMAIPTAGLAGAAASPVHLTPQRRIDAAIEEIKAAYKEMYPTFHLSHRNDVVCPVRYVHGGPDLKLDPHRHCVVVYASENRYGPEKAKWYVEDGSPLLRDATGTNWSASF